MPPLAKPNLTWGRLTCPRVGAGDLRKLVKEFAMSLRRFLGLLCCAGVLTLLPLLLPLTGVYAAPPGSGHHLLTNMTVCGVGGWHHLTLDSYATRIYIPPPTHVILVHY